MKKIYRVTFFFIAISIVAGARPSFAQWEQSNGPYGGVINSVASEGNVMLAGTNSGLFRSTNEGTSWAPVLMIQDGEPQNVYALQTVDASIFAATSSGLLASTDSGATWEAVFGLDLNQSISLMAVGGNLLAVDVGGDVIVDPLNGDFGTGPGYYLGFRNGNVPVDTTAQCVTFASNRVIVGTNFGVYTSSDSGRSWTHSVEGLTYINVTALASVGGIAFAGTDSGGVFFSTDDGLSWTAASSGLTTPLIRSLAVNGDSVYAGTNGGGVFLSTNEGATWVRMSSGLTDPVVNSIAFDGSRIIAGTDGNGVFIFDGEWAPIPSGITATVVNAFASTATGVYAGTSGGGVFLSTNDGASWVPTNSGMTNLYVQALCVKGTDLFAGTRGGGVFVSTDNAATWSPRNNGLNENNIEALTVSGDNLLAGSGFPLNSHVNTGPNNPVNFGAIFLSTDDGSTWSKVDSDAIIVRAFASIGHNVVVTAPWSQVIRSTDNGKTWANVDSGLTYSVNFGSNPVGIQSFTVSGSNIFAGASGVGVYISSDQGVSWRAVDNNLDIVPAIITYNNTVFVSSYSQGTTSGTTILTSYGVLRCGIDSLSSWGAVDSGFVDKFLPPPHLPPVINALTVSGDYLFAGTNGVGVWRI
ncbi:MAG: hypothetical protein M1339_00355, partial [Bacteroidetes bacterium]|nr:hypothetical protein [Bacteroidota bacterium]